ncbi:MAG TPA: hypothetical protein VN704_09100 [Verrucomicrobiae bacterium]|nr:hypothetical protein [Verrucomicrobiae bacterium]
MPIIDFLMPGEQIKFDCKSDVEYIDKKFHLYITNKRLLLYKQRGLFNKCEDLICEKVERLEGMEYKEKGGLSDLAKISIKGALKLDIKGQSKEIKSLFQMLECMKNVE